MGARAGSINREEIFLGILTRKGAEKMKNNCWLVENVRSFFLSLTWSNIKAFDVCFAVGNNLGVRKNW